MPQWNKQFPLNVNVGEMQCAPERRVQRFEACLDSAFEKTVYKGLQHIGTDICQEKPSQQKKQSDYSENSRRKDYEQVISVKKDLKDLNATDLYFHERTRLFMTPCVPTTGYFGTNIKNYDQFSKRQAHCYSLSITNFLFFQIYGLALQFSTQPQ